MSEGKARVIALYLPQFHPTEANDKFWGEGFTEWDNVRQARPLFRGHVQPCLPGDLGFYDLRNPEIRAAQAELARQAGIEGFCYWHYWFGGGKEALTLPLDEAVRLGEPDFPFCVGWANHDWTTGSWRQGKGREKPEMIFQQTYPGEEDEIRHFYRLLPCFRDKRYIRTEGKLLFLVFDPLALPRPKAWTDRWNGLARQEGLGSFHFVGLCPSLPELRIKNLFRTDSLVGADFDRVRAMGFDAIMSTNYKYAEIKTGGAPHKMLYGAARRVKPGLLLEKYRYGGIVRRFYTPADRREDVYPQLLAGWDRSPRAGRQAIVYAERTPEDFERLARLCLTCVAHKPPEKRVVFLNSWNEWGEGAYMEPDRQFGTGFLDALKRVLME